VLAELESSAFVPLSAVAKRGRYPEEVDFLIYRGGEALCVVKVFKGRPPYYSPWAEVFNISQGASAEDLRHVLCVLYRHMEPGDVLYLEYVGDRETLAQLQRGIPPGETRLGKLLEQCGFKIVKDWYFPEGGLKGGMKLQAVKP